MPPEKTEKRDRRIQPLAAAARAAPASAASSEPALQMLFDRACVDVSSAKEARPDAIRSRLWVTGEQAGALQPPQNLTILTNRVDVVQRLRAHGVDCALNDFDFSAWPARSLQSVYYRISKEKAVVHHVINQALLRLRPGAHLWLAGYKQEGLKTYLDKAAGGGEKSLQKGPRGALLGCIRRSADVPVPLPDSNYPELREVHLEPGLTVLTKPGIFGWDKIDAGSRFMVEQLQAHQHTLWPAPPQRLADFGCGYGYLSLMAARLWPGVECVATDSNVAAVAACNANFDRAGVRGEAVAADCGDRLAGLFDAVLCNPPFHQGFHTVGNLGERFLRRASQLLSSSGFAIFVVNQFLPLERLAAPFFSDVRELARNRSYKILVLKP